MGIMNVEARVSRPDGTGPQIPVTLLVDSGAVYSLLPAPVCRALGLVPRREVDFSLADGTIITRGVSECTFEIGDAAATSPVVLGDTDEGPLLGAVTLETLGLVLNPLKRELVPMRLLLATLAVADDHSVPSRASAAPTTRQIGDTGGTP
jgi:predicted aspartyl protease